MRIFYSLFPLLCPFVSTYKKTLFKAHSTRLRLKFLKRCLEEQVIPVSLLPRRLRISEDHPFNDFCVLSLKKHIELTKSDEFTAFKRFRRAKIDFNQQIPHQWKHNILNEVYSVFRVKINGLNLHLNNKLNFLINNSVCNRYCASENNYINLSSKVLSDDVKKALNFGMSFVLDKEISPLELATAINKLSFNKHFEGNIDIAKGLIYSKLNESTPNNFPLRFRKALFDLKKDPNIHITKADKSNCVVILDKVTYNDKILELLSDQTTYKPLNKNPLDNEIKNFNSKIKSILKDNNDLLSKIKINAPSLPYLYGLIKTHKPNLPVRPIISSVGSCTYKLSKYLVAILSPLLGTISDSHIKNGLDICDKLTTININSETRLVSFDVVSLFTKVPIDDLLNFLNEHLKQCNLGHPTHVIINLVKLCILDCTFVFNNKFYKQVFGMAMGNPLSPLLSNLYMEFFEINLLPKIKHSHFKWYRYVDDIIALINSNFNVENFLKELNDLVPSIQFTLEKENNNTIAFLDILVIRSNNSFKFKIYRKPTNNLSYVHFYSGHTKKIKTSVFSSMFLRALRIVSPEYLDEEETIIKNIGNSLCYPSNFLNNCHNKAKKTYFAPNNTDNETAEYKNTICIPYNKNFESIVPLLKQLDIKLVFNFKNNIKNLLIKNSPENGNGLIYKIPCKDCSDFYIGQTSKSLTKRVQQHKYCVRSLNDNNALFLHSVDSSHAINWENSNKVVRCNDYTKRIIMESALIKLTWGSNFNTSHGIVKLDNIILNFLKADLCKFL